MELRNYQQEAVHQLRQAITRSGSAIYCLPTGGGKSLVAAEIAKLAAEKGSRTLFLLHRRELVKQMCGTLQEALPGMSIGVEASGWPSMPWASLQVASVASLARRKHDLKPDLIVVDEAHHCRAASWSQILERWPRAARIGLTATPQRLDGRGLNEHFNELVQGPTIQELVGMGYLAPSRILRIPSHLVLDGVKEDRNGEYRASDVSERLTDAVIADGVQAYLRYAKGKKAIFFAIHRDHSRKICAGLRASGVNAEHCDGDDPPARRDRIMNAFRTGGVSVVGNCDLISEGFDAPACEVILMGSPTKSVTRYLQMAGRAMRPGEGKTALILDLAGISYDLGLPTDTREWSLEDGEILDGKKSRPKPRDCARCYTVFWGRICPTARTRNHWVKCRKWKRNWRWQPGRWRGQARAVGVLTLTGNWQWRTERQTRRRRLWKSASGVDTKSGWATHIIRLWQLKEA